MTRTHRIERIWKDNGNDTVAMQETIGADTEINQDISVADGQTALHAVVGIDVSLLKSLFLSSDQDVTIKTNSSGSPADTLELSANVPLIWSADCGYICPLTVDVTGLYIANDSGSAATVKLRLLQDGTP